MAVRRDVGQRGAAESGRQSAIDQQDRFPGGI
jgi:hypothetical protein